MSRTRLLWVLISILLFILFSAVGLMISKQQQDTGVSVEVTLNMPLKKIASELSITPSFLAKELGIDADIDKEKTAAAYNVTQEKFSEALKHILSHKPEVFKQFIMLGICVFGALFLIFWGKSEKGKKWYKRTPYHIMLIITVAASFWLGKSPSPMEEIVKLFKAHAGLYPDVFEKTMEPLVLILIFVVGVNKIICGWACPFGALQELVSSIPLVSWKKRIKIPFWISNTVRTLIFALFILVLFGVIGDLKGVTIYHYINPFNLFDFSFTTGVVICVIVSLTAGLFIYRPFCHFICPMGFISWIFEQISIFKIRVDHDACIDCGQCSTACPSNACKGIIEQKSIKPDCFSCSRCLTVCPKDAIHFGLKKKK